MTSEGMFRVQRDGSVAVHTPFFAEFPTELTRGIRSMIDWTVLVFIVASLAMHLVLTGAIASREWTDPISGLSTEELMEVQRGIVEQYRVSLETSALDEAVVASETFEQEAARLEADIGAAIAEADRMVQEAQALTDELMQGIDGQPMDGVSPDAGMQEMIAALNAVPGADINTPALELNPVDLAVFADVQNASASRVVAMAMDASLLGSDTQISSRFVSGGISGDQARRLEREIRLARERLGEGIQVRIGTGSVGEDRRDLLRIGSGSRQGQRIRIEQLALPPAVATSSSGRNLAAVETAVNRTRELAGGCYAIGLAENPALMGAVVIRFTIGMDGSVSQVTVIQSSLGSPVVEECLVAAVQTWHFAPGAVAETFEYPFTFEPG